MQKGSKRAKSLINVKNKELQQGYSIEEEVRIATVSNGQLEGNAPLIYTERKEGVIPQYDPRTDRWAVAQDAMDKVAQTVIAKRDAGITVEGLRKEGIKEQKLQDEYKKRLKSKQAEMIASKDE